MDLRLPLLRVNKLEVGGGDKKRYESRSGNLQIDPNVCVNHGYKRKYTGMTYQMIFQKCI